MKKYIPHFVSLLFALWAVADWRTPADRAGAIPANAFARLPVLANGRIQPLDSLARNTLLQIREKQSVRTFAGEQPARTLTAAEWMLEMFFQQELADTRPVFRILHTELKGLLGLPLEADPERNSDGKHFSWNQIRDKLGELRDEARRAGAVAESARTPFDRAVLQLWNSAGLYMRTQNTVQPQDSKNWERELQAFVEAVPAGREAAKAQQAGQSSDSVALDVLVRQLQRASAMKELAPAMVVPPANPGTDKEGWRRVDEVMFDLARGGTTPVALRAYAAMGTAFRGGDAVMFKAAVDRVVAELAPTAHGILAKCQREQVFNHLEPFYKCIVLYVTAGLCVMIFTLAPGRFGPLKDTARLLLLTTLVLHSAGLIYRMVLEGRPPVTNLYSSAIFIGWGACVLGVFLERVWKNGIGVLVSSSAGFLTLIVAHNLALGGDTMEMMRAVLDTNFWLATHVVVVTLGYSATFVAGLLAVLYVLLGFCTKSLTQEMAKSLSKMVYGIVCFAALFSFVGTVLGGIWADQSWGRFWGWDAKENGALMIVLWNALFLHARWGGMARERGLMSLAIFGNVVTAWSWFGVNMLGIGLHSYGFMSAAFTWLMLFVTSQLLLIGFAALPLRYWRSALD
ncbi:MAG: cytochrome C biogenesis protein [Verrucomicrobia bacterium]|nr:cytochrome C biogenesis protein [Verrucomicrobiota bacterium]